MADAADDRTKTPWLMPSLARGVALFFGAFGLLNVAGQQIHPGFSINIWWLDVRWIPSPLSAAWLVLASLTLVVYAVRPRCGSVRLVLTRIFLGWLVIVAAWNTVMFYVVRARGELAGSLWVPLSLIVAAVLAWLWLAVPKGQSIGDRRAMMTLPVVLIVVMILGVLFPLGQMAFFGQTSYARPVDAIVVFGAGVLPSGRMTLALSDRVETACELYREGLAEWLIVSGGPGMGDVHETEAMRAAAIEWGVPADRILVDRDGLDTEATATNTVAMFDDHDIHRVLAVSHWYHLPRIKMTYQRAGWDVVTTPANESRTLVRMPYYVMREVAAVWVYYLRPLM